MDLPPFHGIFRRNAASGALRNGVVIMKSCPRRSPVTISPVSPRPVRSEIMRQTRSGSRPPAITPITRPFFMIGLVTNASGSPVEPNGWKALNSDCRSVRARSNPAESSVLASSPDMTEDPAETDPARANTTLPALSISSSRENPRALAASLSSTRIASATVGSLAESLVIASTITALWARVLPSSTHCRA